MSRHSLAVGVMVDRYRIEGVLGRGGFGITYLAEDTLLHQRVALKEYCPRNAATRDEVGRLQGDETFAWGLERFVNEARIVASFRHAAIVQATNCFEANGTVYLVMVYEEGESLGHRLKRVKRLSEQELLALVLPLLDGLELIHRAGYVHRDIKPDNIFIRRDGTPLILDFGAARQAMGQLTHTLTAILSPGYAPFEQYHGKSSDHGPWTDIYALGAVMYRALGGKTPDEATERTNALLNQRPDPLLPLSRLLEGQGSPPLLAAIDQALNIREQDRPQSIGSWRRELLRVGAACGMKAGFALTVTEDEIATLRPGGGSTQGELPTLVKGSGSEAETVTRDGSMVFRPEEMATPPPMALPPVRTQWWPRLAAGMVVVAVAGFWWSRPGPVAGASLVVESLPTEGTVFLDGREVGRTPFLGQELAAGEHGVRVVKAPCFQEEKVVVLAAGIRDRITLSLKDRCPKAESPPPLPVAEPETWRDGKTGMEFVRVPGGCFQMGDPEGDGDEQEVAEVCVGTFWMGRHEVTQGVWQQVMEGNNPARHALGGAYPVERVSWEEARVFLDRLGRERFDLPTEAQWEHACKTGETGGHEGAWYEQNSQGATHEVGGRPPSGPGLYDLKGNVAEWVRDLWERDGYAKRRSRTDPCHGCDPGGGLRVVRGGSWGDEAARLRCSDRSFGKATFRDGSIGLRLVLTGTPPKLE